jgi:type IV pilus assembly protein PilX
MEPVTLDVSGRQAYMASGRAYPASAQVCAALRRQRGVVLVVALIAMVALMIAGIALMRSLDTANVIAGNFAFRKAATEAADLGIEAAYTALPIIKASYNDSNITSPYYYYGTISTQYGNPGWDANGIPQVTWSGVPAVANQSGNTVRYVVERLCTGALPVSNTLTSCVSDVAADNSSNKIGSTKFTSSTAVYYRVTVQVTGPRNTVSYVQAVLSD